ncbi:c-type cytochrome [Massilia sp. B-10]|nr:c-type cytochrome [Massilia sp. B-10]UUZ54247.1 c-type cytochrome [Massilia sp. H-1]
MLFPLLLAAAPGAQADPAAGKAVYDKVCIACHAVQNVMVASPKLGDKTEWERRLKAAGGAVDTLTDHAMDGTGAMPPKGGAPHLSRAEVKSAIAYMMAPVAAPTTSAR